MAVITPWHRCTCGKLHVLDYAWTWGDCRCECGESLRVTPNGGTTPTCPLCGCLRPDDPERCDICGHHGCQGCVKDGLCSLCFDIEKERNT